MRLTEEQAKAVRDLSGNRDFGIFMNAIADYHEILVRQLIECPADQLPVAQGRAQAILRVTQAVLSTKHHTR
jgi:hypothetical protein